MFRPAQKRFLQTTVCLFFVLWGVWLEKEGDIQRSALCFILSFLIGGYAAAKEGVVALVREKHLTVDVLMVLAAAGAGAIGYWMEGALLILIFSLSGTLEELALAKNKQAITALMALTPEKARRLTSAGDIEVVETCVLEIEDRLQVLKGQVVPTDGILCQGVAVMDESMISGEPLPVEKVQGDFLIGGTINCGETVEMLVTAVAEETIFARMVSLVEQAQSRQGKVATVIDRLEDYYVKVVLLLVPMFIVATYGLLQWDWSTAFYRGMILLTVVSPCALVASATPASLSALSCAARKGLMIKGGDIAGGLGDLKVMVFDKTGTLTQGMPRVSDVLILPDASPDLGAMVKAAERGSNHPISKALSDYYRSEQKLVVSDVSDVIGKGISFSYKDYSWRIGKCEFALPVFHLPQEVQTFISLAEEQGHTLVYLSCDGVLQAIYALSDQVRPEAAKVIKQLKNMGLRTIMLTGDREQTANRIADAIGLDQVVANCLPEDKVGYIRAFQESYGLVGMVGDGINDAPALAAANVGFAVSSGTDIAIESADVVLVDHLGRLPFAIKLSRQLRRITLENMIFALLVIAFLVLTNLSQVISLPQGVIGHEGSTILVILNGLRLLRFKDDSKGCQ